MGTTTGGIIYPDDTDAPDIPADLQTLAESVEAGNAWVTAAASFTAAVNWTTTSFRIKRVGAIVFVHVQVTRATTALTVAAGSGDLANVKLGDLPAGYAPAQNQHLVSGQFGRVTTGYVDTSGAVYLGAVAGDGTNVAVGDVITLGGCYVLG